MREGSNAIINILSLYEFTKFVEICYVLLKAPYGVHITLPMGFVIYKIKQVHVTFLKDPFWKSLVYT
jgi:hypothetical protein